MLKANGEMVVEINPIKKKLEKFSLEKISQDWGTISMEGADTEGNKAYVNLGLTVPMFDNEDAMDYSNLDWAVALIEAFASRNKLISITAERNTYETFKWKGEEVNTVLLTVESEHFNDKLELKVYASDFLFSTNVVREGETVGKISSDPLQ